MNRRVRSMMRKPKPRWLGIGYYGIKGMRWGMIVGQSNRSGLVVRRQLLHKGKKS